MWNVLSGNNVVQQHTTYGQLASSSNTSVHLETITSQGHVDILSSQGHMTLHHHWSCDITSSHGQVTLFGGSNYYG